jgi:hypothetical protein
MTIEKDTLPNSPSTVEKTVDFKLPKDHILDHIEAKCKKHGDITNATFVLTYGTVKNGEKITHTNLFCVQCLAELLQEFQKEGKIETVEVQQIIREMTDEEKQERDKKLKEIEALKQRAKELKEKNLSQAEINNAIGKYTVEAVDAASLASVPSTIIAGDTFEA